MRSFGFRFAFDGSEQQVRSSPNRAFSSDVHPPLGITFQKAIFFIGTDFANACRHEARHGFRFSGNPELGRRAKCSRQKSPLDLPPSLGTPSAVRFKTRPSKLRPSDSPMEIGWHSFLWR